MSSLQGKMGVDVQQTEQSLKLTEAELQLWEHKHRTFVEFGKHERVYLSELAEKNGMQANTVQNLLRTHKARGDAEAQLMELQIAKLKSQVAVYKAMLEEVKRMGPGGRSLIKPS